MNHEPECGNVISWVELNPDGSTTTCSCRGLKNSYQRGRDAERKRILAMLQVEWPNDGDWRLLLREVLSMINEESQWGEQA